MSPTSCMQILLITNEWYIYHSPITDDKWTNSGSRYVQGLNILNTFSLSMFGKEGHRMSLALKYLQVHTCWQKHFEILKMFCIYPHSEAMHFRLNMCGKGRQEIKVSQPESGRTMRSIEACILWGGIYIGILRGRMGLPFKFDHVGFNLYL